MKKLLIIFSVILAGCSKTEITGCENSTLTVKKPMSQSYTIQVLNESKIVLMEIPIPKGEESGEIKLKTGKNYIRVVQYTTATSHFNRFEQIFEVKKCDNYFVQL